MINNPVTRYSALGLLLFSQTALAKTPLTQGNEALTALTGATIHISPEEQVENATLLVKGKKIYGVVDNDDIPKHALVLDLAGYTLYPGFIDPYADYGIEFKYPKPDNKPPVYEVKQLGAKSGNTAIHAEKDWVDYISPNKAAAAKWVNNGFTSVQSAKLDGIFQGRGVTLSLSEKPANEVIYQSQGKHFMSFHKGSSIMDYPNSLMGSMALIRQTFADTLWYQNNKDKDDFNASSPAFVMNSAWGNLVPLEQQQFIFATDNLNSQLRAGHLMQEHSLSATLLGNGKEYARLNELKGINAPVILPLNFPKAPDVSDRDAERQVTLEQLRHWERAPFNPALLASEAIPFALTLHDTDAKAFWKRLRLAVDMGLSKEDALAALTTEAAQIAGVSELAGKLEKGYIADIVVAKGDLFEDGEIYSVWMQGDETILKPRAEQALIGEYQISFNGLELDLVLEQGKKLSGVLSGGEQEIKLSKPVLKGQRLSFSADLTEAGVEGVGRFVIWFDDNKGSSLHGQLTDAKGAITPVAGTRNTSSTAEDEDKDSKPLPTELVGRLTSPNVAYGLSSLPSAEKLHIKNATVWTSEAEGVLENADVLIKDGEIQEVGQSLRTPSGYKVLDAEGKHLTAGIVDEHSHIAINGGTNEGSDAITSEVRIGDILDPDAIAIYRSLSGGVTTAQLLHGSANPIGGQAQLIKLRWGEDASSLKFKGAPSAIKFALGENVKQSNWGDQFTTRFPQTRMGVESLFRDAFDAAMEHDKARTDYDKLRRSSQRKTLEPKPDLRLQAVAEILKDQRDIHIHSYVQSEILMFLQLAEEYNFDIAAFTHVLEGYKLADELAAQGAGASTFSDWWAYKFEVYDAIPQNACLMNDKGVLTSINSDDYEMQRRLNQEAAKSVMYCGMSETDALNMITINPAKQLGVGDKVGSIKEGKQADLVLWDTHPLSVYAKTQAVWVDGKRYFDRTRNQQETRLLGEERAALIQKLLASPASRKQGELPADKLEPEWHCDTHYNAWGENSHIHSGHNHSSHNHH
ncbi:amidohydrolase family protein [Shewanella corallii]|uniref:Amidohydrolase family protein n=1 Tax=Shewanella corallii TaxID=560080 RepID=A0ABT0N543_9GAMM|nr:amidohydrolase family protein [Shewanella corallii]MCL2913006.1 amidohydrolase family protein [Shewanella corallii]